ncbi:MAG: D-2-hydroxyacid dehydrogenase [Gemmatimonadota bacterium]|nr:D-2-hydroxyacid dehydrogenase [Gemmatimonadota bacterium]
METVLIASWIEPHLVERIREVGEGIRVVYEPGLLRLPRYPADHKGGPRERSEAEERRWRESLASATILFDFDQTHLEDLPDVAPNVRWIQATSSGIGQFVRRMGYAARMPDTVFTTARGVHARPLAEFVAMAMTIHARRGLHMVRQQAEKSWERFAGRDLEGQTIVIVGLGAVGEEVVRIALAHGMRVVAVRRRPELGGPSGVDRVLGPQALVEALPEADFLVLVTPHTDETERMIGRTELAALPAGCALVNIGRGALLDEPALVDALASGHVGGAYLDVFQEEPLPADSPLWDMTNVLVSPHSASTSDRENERIVDLFIDNLDRWLRGVELRNVLDAQRLY